MRHPPQATEAGVVVFYDKIKLHLSCGIWQVAEFVQEFINRQMWIPFVCNKLINNIINQDIRIVIFEFMGTFYNHINIPAQ